MDDAPVVRGSQSTGDLRADLARPPDGQHAVDEPLTQRLSVEQLGHQIGSLSWPAARASVSNRARRSGSSANDAGKDLDGDVASKLC
jgi:hypothetical protein